jgi:hypothetical protein
LDAGACQMGRGDPQPGDSRGGVMGNALRGASVT